MHIICIHLVTAKQLTLLNFTQHACTQHVTPCHRIGSITMSTPISYSWIPCSGCGYLDIMASWYSLVGIKATSQQHAISNIVLVFVSPITA